MENDFSVRNEVDSVMPPHSDSFDYIHEPSPYDKVVDGINSAPPFPYTTSQPPPYSQPYYPAPPNPHYNSIIDQQLLLIKQQQQVNDRLMNFIASKETINWKYISILLGLFCLFLIFRPSRVIRRNPRLVEYLEDLSSDY